MNRGVNAMVFSSTVFFFFFCSTVLEINLTYFPFCVLTSKHVNLEELDPPFKIEKNTSIYSQGFGILSGKRLGVSAAISSCCCSKPWPVGL